MLPAFRYAGRNAAFGAVGVSRLNTALAPSIWLAQPQRAYCTARARQSDWASVTLHRLLYQYSLNVRFKDQPPPAVPDSSELGKLEERLGCGRLPAHVNSFGARLRSEHIARTASPSLAASRLAAAQ